MPLAEPVKPVKPAKLSCGLWGLTKVWGGGEGSETRMTASV